MKHETLAQALLAAQKNIGGAKKGSNNPFFKSKYADLGSVIEAVKDAMNDEGISILQPVDCEAYIGPEDKVTAVQFVKTVLIHESGERCESKTYMPSIGDPQKQGAAITYFRRFALQSLLLVPAEDDDGNSLSKPAPTAQPESKPAFLGKKG
jgi:hypothetical protein